ncbi:hypothetical protein L195_g062686, partial [Trifolium pratense]
RSMVEEFLIGVGDDFAIMTTKWGGSGN